MRPALVVLVLLSCGVVHADGPWRFKAASATPSRSWRFAADEKPKVEAKDDKGRPSPAVKSYPGYFEVQGRALKENTPVVLWVDCRPRHIDGAISCREKSFEGTTGPTVIVAVPRGDWFERFDLPISSNDTEIRAKFTTPAPARAVPAPQQSFTPVRQSYAPAVSRGRNC